MTMTTTTDLGGMRSHKNTKREAESSLQLGVMHFFKKRNAQYSTFVILTVVAT